MLMRSWLQVQSSDRPIILIFSNCSACTSTFSHCLKINCLSTMVMGQCMSITDRWLQIHYCSWRSSPNFLTHWSGVKRSVALTPKGLHTISNFLSRFRNTTLLFKSSLLILRSQFREKEMTNLFHVRTNFQWSDPSSNRQREIANYRNTLVGIVPASCTVG